MFEFEWDFRKELENINKHELDFHTAKLAFFDEHRIIYEDTKHSSQYEKRYFCFGKVENEIITVRFTYRTGTIRIIGAGYWRKGKKIYEEENRLH